jgi:hypothetical protein
VMINSIFDFVKYVTISGIYCQALNCRGRKRDVQKIKT